MSDKVDIPESYLNDTAEMLFKKGGVVEMFKKIYYCLNPSREPMKVNQYKKIR